MTADDRLVLYFAPGSSSMAPHIALNEVGARFDLRRVSLANSETRTPEFLAINPEGKVPVLLAEGRVLTEVAGILYYLARRYPAAGLMPMEDPMAEAEVVSWMSFLASTVHPARRQGEEHAMAVYALVEQRLAGRDWCVGETMTTADIHLFRLFWRFGAALPRPPQGLPALTAHHERMMARPAVQATIKAEVSAGYELPA